MQHNYTNSLCIGNCRRNERGGRHVAV